jgi:hypothetical protein
MTAWGIEPRGVNIIPIIMLGSSDVSVKLKPKYDYEFSVLATLMIAKWLSILSALQLYSHCIRLLARCSQERSRRSRI